MKSLDPYPYIDNSAGTGFGKQCRGSETIIFWSRSGSYLAGYHGSGSGSRSYLAGYYGSEFFFAFHFGSGSFFFVIKSSYLCRKWCLSYCIFLSKGLILNDYFGSGSGFGQFITDLDPQHCRMVYMEYTNLHFIKLVFRIVIFPLKKAKNSKLSCLFSYLIFLECQRNRA